MVVTVQHRQTLTVVHKIQQQHTVCKWLVQIRRVP